LQSNGGSFYPNTLRFLFGIIPLLCTAGHNERCYAQQHQNWKNGLENPDSHLSSSSLFVGLYYKKTDREQDKHLIEESRLLREGIPASISVAE
jgi:hypothetical protein